MSMTEISPLIDALQTGGFISLLIILAFPTLRKKFGFTEGQHDDDERLGRMLKKILVDDEKSPILVKSQIVRICDDINTLKEDVAIIKQVIIK